MGEVHYAGQTFRIGGGDQETSSLRQLVERIVAAGGRELVPAYRIDQETDQNVSVWMLVGPDIPIAFSLPWDDDDNIAHFSQLSQKYPPT